MTNDLADTGHEPRHGFPSTIWTEVWKAGRPDVPGAEEALEALLMKYARPLRRHLMWRFGFPEEEATDLLHEFVHRRILLKNLLSRAAREKGSFRGFICSSLRNFVSDQIRQQKSKNRAPEGGLCSLEELKSIPAEPATSDPSISAWAEEALHEAIRLFQLECTRLHRPQLWQLFEARLLRPLLDGTETPGYADLVQALEFPSPGAAYKALNEAKGLFQQCLERAVGGFAFGDSQEEILALRRELTGRNRSVFRI